MLLQSKTVTGPLTPNIGKKLMTLQSCTPSPEAPKGKNAALKDSSTLQQSTHRSRISVEINGITMFHKVGTAAPVFITNPNKTNC